MKKSFPAGQTGPIGVFDSGYGGLTVMRSLVDALPQYDYCYLGDNARVPYGSRSFETVYRFTLECVEQLFEMGCPLVILACNTASAKALRSIQQHDLPKMAPDRRVLGVIRPTTEKLGLISKSGAVGILGTQGTVQSASYSIELAKFFPAVKVYQQACPMWVPLVENGEHMGPGADYFVANDLRQLLQQDPHIDTLLLACTHYPLLLSKISTYAGINRQIITQGPLVAESLADYLQRHPEMEKRLHRHGKRSFYTTDSAERFNRQAALFFGETVVSNQLILGH